MKIEGYAVLLNTSATNYRGQSIEAVPYWKLYIVNRLDRKHPVRTPIGVYSMDELQNCFRNMRSNEHVLLPNYSFEAYARASRHTNYKRDNKSSEQTFKLLKKKIKQLEKKLNELEE